jgi:hypothetical protein
MLDRARAANYDRAAAIIDCASEHLPERSPQLIDHPQRCKWMCCSTFYGAYDWCRRSSTATRARSYGWVGCVLRIGGMRMRVDKRDGRCVVITIDPVTTERNAAILRTVARDRQGCLGVYGSTVEPGRVAVNDPVLIESPV